MDITLCLIVRNEEKRLPGFLNTFAGYFDEIIIADTGSTDRTREIISGIINESPLKQISLYEISWQNDFAKARNFTLEKANSEWIMWLDPDDTFDIKLFSELRKFLENITADALRLPVYSVSSPDESLAEHPAPLYQVRVFRNTGHYRFRGFLHEFVDIDESRRADFDFPILHFGYADPVELAGKDKRNLEILRKRLTGFPDDVYALFLYIEYLKSKRLWGKETAELLNQFFSLKKERDFTYYKMKLAAARNHYYLGNTRESLENAFEALDLLPDLAEAYLWLGGYFYTINQLEYASEYFFTILSLKAEQFCGRLAFPLDYRYIPLINLGRIEFEKGNKEKSVLYFREALKFKKDTKFLNF